MYGPKGTKGPMSKKMDSKMGKLRKAAMKKVGKKKKAEGYGS